jgi:hypothetical protein
MQSDQPAQLDIAAVRRMSATAIDTALREGRLADLLAGRAVAPSDPPDRPPQLTREDLATLTPEQIQQAEADGQLADLLGRKNSS